MLAKVVNKFIYQWLQSWYIFNDCTPQLFNRYLIIIMYQNMSHLLHYCPWYLWMSTSIFFGEFVGRFSNDFYHFYKSEESNWFRLKLVYGIPRTAINQLINSRLDMFQSLFISKHLSHKSAFYRDLHQLERKAEVFHLRSNLLVSGALPPVQQLIWRL